jgi:D-lyxose ketol-isomerase
MKRSQINAILSENIAFLKRMGFNLPPFAYWTPAEWAEKGRECDEIRENMLGWDITDYGHNDYENIGLFLFTMRNGNLRNSKYKKPYAEKLLITKENQVTPMHFHWRKMEDIINRGGGNLMIELWQSDGNEGLSDAPVTVAIDGVRSQFEAGTVVRLLPGQSITLTQGLYHKFWGEKGHGTVLIGEVSTVNDDNADNRFYERQGRFPKIEEDERPLYLLCNEYPSAE